MTDSATFERPVYRHIVVRRRGFIEKVASPEQFRRLRAQVDAGRPLDEDVAHLYRADTVKQTMQKVMSLLVPCRKAGFQSGTLQRGAERKQAFTGSDRTEIPPGIELSGKALLDEADAMKAGGGAGPVRYRGQPGIVVATLNRKHIPGGDEPLPLTPTVLSHPGFDVSEDPAGDFLKAALHLRTMFVARSDRKFLLLDKWARQSTTLVTVAYTPILAAPRTERGLELFCEFHQTTRFGHVDTDGFEVCSDSGEYPISAPNPVELVTMMRSADELRSTTSG